MKAKGNKAGILFLLPYPLHRAPSQRFRIENFLPVLQEAGIPYTLRPFMSEKTWSVLYKGGSINKKAAGIIKSFASRVYTVLFEAKRYDRIVIHREAAPLGPPVFEWYLTKVLRKKVTYDFDDAIWIPNTSEQNRLISGLKAFWKVGKICRWVDTVFGGNDFLCEYALSKGAAKALKVPTVVDTEFRYNKLKTHKDGKLTIGWTGSHSTLKYLDEVMPLLSELQERHDFRFLVIADKKPVLPLKDWDFLPWNESGEMEDLLQIDIGIMPLTIDKWSEGKCGFKLIQYLALGIPAIATNVGVNEQIVEQGKSGFLCDSLEEWSYAFEQLICSSSLRSEYGLHGRQRIISNYSINSQVKTWLSSLL